MFRAHVLIVRRAKLYYTVSGIIITPIGCRSVHGTATYRCDDTRDCIIQFCPPDDEHICSKHVEAWNKLIKEFSASSWLILINKYIEIHGQENIKKKNTYFCVHYLFLYENLDINETKWKNIVERGTDDNMAHTHCTLNTFGSRTRLNVTLQVHCPYCLYNKFFKYM